MHYVAIFPGSATFAEGYVAGVASAYTFESYCRVLLAYRDRRSTVSLPR